MLITKIIFSSCLLLLFNPETVYQQTVPTIEGNVQSLQPFHGKKLLIVTLPLSQSASSDSLLYALDTLATAHAETMKVIATPAYEDGYTINQKESLKSWYRSKLGADIIITDGLYTRKISGYQQHSLFRWLTNSALNGHFDMDIIEPETKFFINTDGKIYGVLRSHTKMWSVSLNRVINSPIVTE